MTEPYYISITEFGEIWRCMRMWDWTSPSRKGLMPAGPTPSYFHTGSACHYAVEANACGLDWRVELDRWFRLERVKYRERYVERTRAEPSEGELAFITKDRDLIFGMMENYFRRFGVDNPIKPYTYVIPELTFCIPTGIKLKDGREIHIVGTFDGVARDETERFYVAENKTFSSKPDRGMWEVDWQGLGYVTCLEHLIQEPVVGLLYNGLGKVLPRYPDIRKTDGRVSKAAIVTTAGMFKEALIRNGQRVDDPEYASLIRNLEVQDRTINSGGNPFWARFVVTYTSQAKRSWMENAFAACRYIASEPEITWNRKWDGCWDCAVEKLCRTQIRGGDLDYLLRGYAPSSYGTRLTLRMTEPDSIHSTGDLLSLASRRLSEIQERGHLDEA